MAMSSPSTLERFLEVLVTGAFFEEILSVPDFGMTRVLRRVPSDGPSYFFDDISSSRVKHRAPKMNSVQLVNMGKQIMRLRNLGIP